MHVLFGNAVGSVSWAWVSDAITRRWPFLVISLMQLGLFWMLPNIATASLLNAIAFIVLMCYSGGFCTMPAFAADYSGSKNVGSIYGLMLTAWGLSAV